MSCTEKGIFTKAKIVDIEICLDWFRERVDVVVKEVDYHPKLPGSNLVKTYSFFQWPRMLCLQLPRSVITSTDENRE